MKIRNTPLQGVFLLEMELHEDQRGYFGRLFCPNEAQAKGLHDAEPMRQMSLSGNRERGTLRGMHYQLPPCDELKLVHCICGIVYDVVLDLRPASTTFGRWWSQELSSENRLTMYIPKGCAHGFMTLTDNASLLYMMSAPHSTRHERGLRWDDPRFGIVWPLAPVVISERDRAHPLFDPVYHLAGVRG